MRTYIEDPTIGSKYSEQEEHQPEKCEACLEEAEFLTRLGIHRISLKLNPESKVCAGCLEELHDELIINQTE